MASAPLLCVRSTSDCLELARVGITNTLPRPGAGEQGRAAIGRRMARRQIRMFAESLPSLPGGCAGGLPRPLSGLQMEEFGGEVAGLVVVKCTRLLVLVQGGGAGVHQAGAAASHQHRPQRAGRQPHHRKVTVNITKYFLESHEIFSRTSRAAAWRTPWPQ